MVEETPKGKTVRVMLVGFSPVVRAGLQAILATDQKIQEVRLEVVPAVAMNEKEALLQMKQYYAQRQAIDVVLTETQGSELDGAQATRLIKEEFLGVSVLVLTESVNDSNVIDAIQAGAGGYIFLKDMPPAMLLESIHRVIEGGTQMKTELLRNAVNALIENGRKTLAERTAEAAHLTPREIDVLRLMANGDTNKAIAENLSISEDTTKKHVKNVVGKLGARNRTHAAIIAAKAGIVGRPVTPLVPSKE